MRSKHNIFGYSREYGNRERQRQNMSGNIYQNDRDFYDDFYGHYERPRFRDYDQNESDIYEGEYENDRGSRFPQASPRDRFGSIYNQDPRYNRPYREDDEQRPFYEDDREHYSRGEERGLGRWFDSWDHPEPRMPRFNEDRNPRYYGEDNWAPNGNRGNMRHSDYADDYRYPQSSGHRDPREDYDGPNNLIYYS